MFLYDGTVRYIQRLGRSTPSRKCCTVKYNHSWSQHGEGSVLAVWAKEYSETLQMSADAQTGRWQGGMIAGRMQLSTPSGCGCMQGEIRTIHSVRMEDVYCTCT